MVLCPGSVATSAHPAELEHLHLPRLLYSYRLPALLASAAPGQPVLPLAANATWTVGLRYALYFHLSLPCSPCLPYRFPGTQLR